jgi:hypothetical protein
MRYVTVSGLLREFLDIRWRRVHRILEPMNYRKFMQAVRWPHVALAGGLLLVAGAVSPWLKVYTQLFDLQGTTAKAGIATPGAHGWFVLGAGVAISIDSALLLLTRRDGFAPVAAFVSVATGLAVAAVLASDWARLNTFQYEYNAVTRTGALFGYWIVAFGAALALASGMGALVRSPGDRRSTHVSTHHDDTTERADRPAEA